MNIYKYMYTYIEREIDRYVSMYVCLSHEVLSNYIHKNKNTRH